MKPHHFRTAIAVLLLAQGVAGCHAMRFNVSDTPHEKVVYERKSYFLGGLFTTQNVDVSTRCPHGVAAVREETTFTDGVLGILAGGLWQPRSSLYFCLPQPKGAVQ